MKEFDYSEANIARTIEKDYFSRNRYLLNLIDVIYNCEKCSTFAIDGVWGSGKTVFVHQLQYLINNSDAHKALMKKFKHEILDEDVKKIKVLYFNAWENDLIGNPAVNLLDGLIKKYAIFEKDSDSTYRNLWKTCSDIGLKLATKGALSLKDFYPEDITEEQNQLATAQNYIDLFSKTIESIKTVSEAEKVLIIVDELDRCKPSYAVELLETIKHFYIDDNIIFLISTDINQLAQTVRKQYGQEFNGDLYLQRFFDGFFTLTIPSINNYVAEELAFNLDAYRPYEEIYKAIINYEQLSIREINKYIKQIKTLSEEIKRIVEFQKGANAAKAIYVPWGLAIKYNNSNRFQKFRHGTFDEEEIRRFLLNNQFILEWIYNSWFSTRDGFNVNQTLERMIILYKNVFREDMAQSNRIENNDILEMSRNIKEHIKSLLDF